MTKDAFHLSQVGGLLNAIFLLMCAWCWGEPPSLVAVWGMVGGRGGGSHRQIPKRHPAALKWRAAEALAGARLCHNSHQAACHSAAVRAAPYHIHRAENESPRHPPFRIIPPDPPTPIHGPRNAGRRRSDIRRTPSPRRSTRPATPPRPPPTGSPWRGGRVAAPRGRTTDRLTQPPADLPTPTARRRKRRRTPRHLACDNGEDGSDAGCHHQRRPPTAVGGRDEATLREEEGAFMNAVTYVKPGSMVGHTLRILTKATPACRARGRQAPTVRDGRREGHVDGAAGTGRVPVSVHVLLGRQRERAAAGNDDSVGTVVWVRGGRAGAPAPVRLAGCRLEHSLASSRRGTCGCATTQAGRNTEMTRVHFPVCDARRLVSRSD